MIAPKELALEPLTALVDNLKQAWRAGEFPDAEGALREHPDLMQYRSLVVDLVYEEYCVREEIGDPPDPEGFCHKFPVYRSHIRDVICGHRLLAAHPGLIQPVVCWPQPGESFDQLTIVRELGRGTFARVYLAHEFETGGRPVVVKLAPTRSGEARTLGGITHDNIVTVLWARQTSGFFAVCMPFVGSVTFRDVIESWFQTGTMPTGRSLLEAVALSGATQDGWSGVPVLMGRESHAETVAAISSRLADAVSYLHRRGIAHGDLKPSNVLLGPGARPYLIDFNLSTGQAGSLLQRGGTLPYMPPEQLRFLLGEGEEGTAMDGDVYSFGAMLFEALTGRVPFEPGPATDPMQLAAELLRCQEVCGASPTRRTGIPALLARVIDRCLAPNPAARPSMDSVKQAIDQYRTRHRPRQVYVAVGASLTVALAGWLAATKGSHAAQPVPMPDITPPPRLVQKSHFELGVESLKAGVTDAALIQFRIANKETPSAKTAAYLGYTYSFVDRRAAISDYRQAIERGDAPAWVHNNLARGLIESSFSADWKTAVIEANNALTKAPDLLQARLNRAEARFKLSGPAGAPVSAETLADIEAVMSYQWDSAGLYLLAAKITARFGCGREECHSRAIGYVKSAILLGRTTAGLEDDVDLKRLKDNPDFKAALNIKPGTNRNVPIPSLVCPPLE